MPETSAGAQINPSETASLPVVAAVLAAGLSRRMSAQNKLLQEIDGAPMVRKVVEYALASKCDRVVVVLGHDAQAVRAALSGLNIAFVENTEYKEGLAASVRAAASAVQAGEALLVCLGDMPRAVSEVFNQLVEAYRCRPDKVAYQPVFEGRGGNPVLWAPAAIAGMRALRGDEGARSLLRKHAQKVMEVPVQSSGIFMDIDTPAALQAARQEKFPRT